MDLSGVVKSVMRNTGAVRGKLVCDATLRNMPNALKSYAVSRSMPLGPRWSHKPWIVVGAGPSLDNNRDQLEAARGKAIVCAVNTACKAVRSDVCISIESARITDHLDPDMTDAFVLSMESHADTWALALESGKPVFWISLPNTPFLAPYRVYDVPMLPYQHSVSCAATALAMHWGCSPIILVGMDLSHAKDGRTHGAGTGREEDTIEIENGWLKWHVAEKNLEPMRAVGLEQATEDIAIELPGWGGALLGDGETVWTSPDLVCQLDWFQNLAADYHGRYPSAYRFSPFVNCTEGGAHIDGWTDVRLADVLEHLPERGAVNWHENPTTVTAEQYEVARQAFDDMINLIRPKGEFWKRYQQA